MNPLESNSLDSSVSYKLSNDFSTIKVNDIENVIAADRVQPRQVSTGVNRGTQRINNTDGSYITLGLIPNSTEFGIAFFDANNNRQSISTALTDFKYNISGINYYQSGLLPDGTSGMIFTDGTVDVADVL